MFAFIRPSNLLRSIEDGFVGAGQLVGRTAAAAAGSVADRGHRVRIEYQARQLAQANLLVDRINTARSAEEIADRAAIAERCEQLIAAKRSARKRAAR